MNIRAIIKSWIKVNAEFVRVSLAESRAVESRDIRCLYDDVHFQSCPVFVLSTGRCGTEYLTAIFDKIAGVGVYHSLVPELIYYSKYAYETHSKRHQELTAAFDASRYEIISREFLAGRSYIETNNRITFFAHQIRDLYPKSRFIHLVRHPAAFIRSGLSRAQPWYSGKNRHDEGRIIPINEPGWKDWPQIRKVGWLWNETNSFIESFKETIEPSRIITVRAENLFADQEVVRKVLEFAGISVAVRHLSIPRRPKNRSLHYRLPEYLKWSQDDRNDLLASVSIELALRYGYKDLDD